MFQQFDARGDSFGIRHVYASTGYPQKQIEARNSASNDAIVYYQVHAMDGFGNVTSFSQNGVKGEAEGNITTLNQYNNLTGFLEENTVSNGSVIQHNDYQFDGVGNLRKRERKSLKSTYIAQKEEFKYDDLNRLTQLSDGSQSGYFDIAKYFNNGNISWKRGVGYYCYGGSSRLAVTAVTSQSQVTQGSSSTACTINNYQYDSAGNMLAGRNRSITYSHFDKPISIASTSGETTTFKYGLSRNRYQRESEKEGVKTKTIYIGSVEETYVDEVHTQTLRYLPGAIQTHFISTGVISSRYLHKDHLGSVNSITNENGELIDKVYFDAWGKRSSIDKVFWGDVAASQAALSLTLIAEITHRGFTGHEHIEHADIIHMNGRIYDPTLGRFLQADPFIQAPKNSQSYNRYAYVLNNPLSYTDPSGYFFKGIGKFAGNFLRALASQPVLNAVAHAAACYYGGPLGCAEYAAYSTYATTGSLKTAFKNGAIAFATAKAFQKIGQHFQAKGIFNGTGSHNLQLERLYSFGGNPLTASQIAQQIAAHAVVGGVAAELSGGKFGHGFVSAGLTKAMNINKLIGNAAKDAGLRVATAAIVGGTISKLTGGKFANGAITAAFAQAFNGEQQAKRQRTEASIKDKLMGLVDEYGDEALRIMQGIGGAAQVAGGLATCIQTAGAGCVVAAHGVSNMMEALGVTDGNVVKQFYMDTLGDTAGKTLYYAIDIGSAGAAASARTLAPSFLNKATHTRSIHYSPTSGRSALGNTHMNFAADSYRAFMTTGGGSLAINDAIVMGNGMYNDYGK